jgi:thiol:disulfide interchange protein/DsbC/DsbD-like thiol-disulfide interchange protein
MCSVDTFTVLRWRRARLAVWLGWVSLIFGLATGLRAQVEASLVALHEEIAADAETVVVGLRLAHQPKWHTYWLQPGTGLPTTLDWDLPPGWSAGPIRWPIPERVYDTAGNLAGQGYEGVVVLPVELRPAPGLRSGETVSLRAKTEWLMCKDVCIPGKAELRLELRVRAPGAAEASPQPELAASLARVPGPAPADWQFTATRAQPGAKSLRLTLRLPEGETRAAAEGWFFDADAGIAYEAPQTPVPGLAAGTLAWELIEAEYEEPTPERLRGVLRLGADEAYEIDVPVTLAPPPELTATRSWPGLLALAFGGGLILNLMPCVFPVLGLKVMGFVQQAGLDRRKITAHALTFTAGVLLSFWVLAGLLTLLRAGGDRLGWGFQLQEPAFVYALAALLLAFALNLSGVFEFALRATALGGDLQRREGLGGSFFSGVLATVVATPCSAPFLAPALGAALALPTGPAFALFTAIGLGLAAPYLALALFPRAVNALPRPGAWMETFKQGMAFLLYGTCAYLIWVLAGQLEADGLLHALLALTGMAAALWGYGRVTAPGASRRGLALAAVLGAGALALGLGWPRAASPDQVSWEPWSAARVEELRAEGRPVYVDFTARWCFTCQTNKKAVFAGPGSAEVLRRFRAENVATLRADWTNRDAAITAELARFGRAAVPFNLFYLPGRDAPVILPELLVPATVLAALDEVGDGAAERTEK